MKRLRLAHLPTPLVRPARLAERLGIELWVKRDDATGGAEGGNKVRKLELLLAAALEARADTVVTCGGIQSNHARATALCAAALGLRAVLYLRVPDLSADDDGAGIPWSAEVAPLAGNVLLDRLAGAELRLITPASYRERDAVMARGAATLRAAGARPYVIPEGGSNGLGALGYVEAMGEVARQLEAGEAGGRPFDLVVHAASSGGTAAGVALGAAKYRVAGELRAFAVSDDAATTTARVVALLDEARSLDATLGLPVRWSIDERARGPAYAVSTPEQREHIAAAARLGGLVLDPVYTGKAFSGLWDLSERGELRGERVLFVHTGGLPGLLAEAATFADVC